MNWHGMLFGVDPWAVAIFGGTLIYLAVAFFRG
jgi:hypothetical protein